MNFDHTDDRRMLADSLTRFLAKEYPFDVRNRIANSVPGYCKEHWAQLAELGVIGALFAQADGGYGGAGRDIALVFELLGRRLVVEPFLGSLLAGSAIASGDSQSQRALLTDIIDGTCLATMAHSEPEAGYELSVVRTSANAVNGGWVVDGRKVAVQSGEQSDLIVLSARTSGTADDTEGISLFIVPRDTSGLHWDSYANIDGGRSADLTLNNVLLPASALVGEIGHGYQILTDCFGRGIVALCAEALGAMEAAKQTTLEFLQTRRQFGVTIGSFQALQHRMANMLLDLEQSRSAVINAAVALDTHGVAREKALSAAKVTIGQVGARIAEECIQLHGGIGMTWELPLAHYAKRLIMIDHQLGDEDYHLARYIALGHHIAETATHANQN